MQASPIRLTRRLQRVTSESCWPPRLRVDRTCPSFWAFHIRLSKSWEPTVQRSTFHSSGVRRAAQNSEESHTILPKPSKLRALSALARLRLPPPPKRQQPARLSADFEVRLPLLDTALEHPRSEDPEHPWTPPSGSQDPKTLNTLGQRP